MNDYHLLTWLLLLGIPSLVYSQSQNFEDGFEDGNFTSNPAWNGNIDQYSIIDGTPNSLLQLQGDAENGGVSYLSTHSTDSLGSWEFYIQLDFPPSGGNKADIFLMSDIANLEGLVNGYVLRAGESGSDDVFRIIRYEQGEAAATVLSGTTDISSGGSFRVKVVRQTGGIWTMEVAEGYDGNLSEEGSPQTDTAFTSTNYFGVRSTYTSSRADLFSYDFKIDIPPLRVMNATANENNITVRFNRPVNKNTVQIGDFSINNGIGSPYSISFPSPQVVKLTYDNALASDLYTVNAQNIQDLEGSSIENNASISFFVFASASRGDVIINEFMYEPPSGQAEYVEIKNISDKFLNLQDWLIGDNANKGIIAADTLALAPGNLLVISRDTSALFNIYGQQSYVASQNLPTLNNNGDTIKLITANEELADSLSYSSQWSSSTSSLERRSASISGIYQENWDDSPALNGGTPGSANLIATDKKPPVLNSITIVSELKLQLLFDERLDSMAVKPENYDLSGVGINSVTLTAPDTVELSLNTALENAEQYQLMISGQQDIFGNTITSTDTSFTYYKVSAVDSSDVFINEFMADPSVGHPEYIELYNPTQKTLDLQQWTINDNTGYLSALSDEKYLLPPDGFVVLTTDSTLSTIDPDIPFIDMGSQFPALNNSGDDIVLRDSSGTLLDSLRYTNSWGTTEKALERRSRDLPSFFKANWGNPSDTTGSPGRANLLPPDTQSPTLISLNIKNDQSLQLIFNEQITAPSGNERFSISGDTQIRGKRFFSPDTVQLLLSKSLQNATSYKLSISNIQDLFGNTTSTRDTLFTYYESTIADSGQVFINEFNYNPAAGNTEYIEIYNPTNHSFDLKNWTLSDNRGQENVVTANSFILPPNSFAVLAPDNTLLETNPDIALITMGNKFPALNNSGDNIILRNGAGIRLDSLQFTSAWGGQEVSLERRTTAISGVFKENWGAASNKIGSVGKKNNIATDQEAPQLISLQVLDKAKIQLLFSECLSRDSATDRSNFQISPKRNIQLISARSDSVTLFLAKPLISEQQYTITLSGISDIFGNQSSKAHQKIEYVEIKEAQKGDIVINEIMDNPGPNSAEFVELYNRSDKNIEISNWSLSDAMDEVQLPSGRLLKGGQYLILTGSSMFAQENKNAVLVTGFPHLNNTEDALVLHNPSGRTIDSLAYTSAWPDTDTQNSLERKDPRSASNDPSNWATNSTEQGNSAGIQNKAFQKDTAPPDVVFAKVGADQYIEVFFNEFIQKTEELQFTLEGVPLKEYNFNPNIGNRIILEKPSKPIETAITIQNLTDIRGNKTSTTEIPLAQPLAKGDLVINEIMYNPLDKGDDNKPDQSEYIELYNTRDYALSLEGLVLHDAPDEDGAIRELQPVSTTAKWVQSNKTVLVYADQATAFGKSELASFFNLDTLATQSVMQIERTSLSLASTDDAIFIADSTGMAIDSVFYSETWHNPNLIDHRGLALERITPGGASNTSANWSSSVHSKGGTPHAQNSLYQERPEQPQKVGISFAPNPFSPDGDGYEDNLVISYTLDQADYLLRVNIFDRYGRHIKELADGKPAGFEGSLVWDGRRDDGRRNRIGIYIIVFEAYDSSSGNDKAFKKTVVVARKLN